MSKANYSKAVPVDAPDRDNTKQIASQVHNSGQVQHSDTEHYTMKLMRILLVLAAVVGCIYLVYNSTSVMQKEMLKALSIALGLCMMALLSERN